MFCSWYIFLQSSWDTEMLGCVSCTEVLNNVQRHQHSNASQASMEWTFPRSRVKTQHTRSRLVCMHLQCLDKQSEKHSAIKCPSSAFGPITCIGSKFTQMSTHPGVIKFCMEHSLKFIALSTINIWSKKLHVILKVINNVACTDKHT